VLVTRDPAVIRAVLSDTGDKPGQFDRDTSPSTGIARATGEDSLLYANGPLWRRQKKIAAPPFSRSSLFQPEEFHEFERTFRKTIAERLDALRARQAASGERVTRIRLEPEIQVVMLEMLVNNFFGGRVSYEELRDRFVPAITELIDHMVRDTVALFRVRRASLVRSRADYEALTDIALSGRAEGRGLWKQFQSDATDEALRSNVRVFLAGALEATTSFASWAIAHLSRAPELQERVHAEVKDLEVYDPDNLAQAATLGRVLEETLRLTPSLYFLPRRAAADTWIETADDRRMLVPVGTHVVLDVWHSNRCEDFWGEAVTGFPALAFAPDRWEVLARQGRSAKESLHFGFGHGPRICPGKFLGLLEVGLVVGAIVKVFRFRAAGDETRVKAGVSTKPADGVLVDLELRAPEPTVVAPPRRG
jgi:cytochrome P450